MNHSNTITARSARKPSLLLALLVLSSLFLVSSRAHADYLYEQNNYTEIRTLDGAGVGGEYVIGTFTLTATSTIEEVTSSLFISITEIEDAGSCGTNLNSLGLGISLTGYSSRLTGINPSILVFPESGNNFIETEYTDWQNPPDELPPGNYNVVLYTACDGYVKIKSSNNQFWGYIATDSDSGFTVSDDESRINSFSSPLNESVQSTSVSFTGTYYIASTSIATTSNVYFYIQVSNTSDNSTSSINNSISLSFPVTSLDTIVSFSTTTTLINDSRYIWYGNLRRGDVILGKVPFNDGLLPSGYDFAQFTTGNFDPVFGKNYSFANCNPFGDFEFGDCLYNMFMPNEPSFASSLDLAKNTYSRAWPIGYVSRVIEIFASSTVITPPNLTIDLPIAGEVTLSPWGKIMGETSILGQGTASFTVAGDTVGNGLTLRQNIEDEWIYFLYFLLGVFIIKDIFGIALEGHNQFGKKGALSDKGDEAYRLKEALYKQSYRGKGGYGPFK